MKADRETYFPDLAVNRPAAPGEALHLVDITMFWTPSSGGVRTYLKAKDNWLAKQPGMRHTLLVPGASAAPGATPATMPAPPIPFGNGYRFPLRRRPWVEQLVKLRPDIIEAGDPYVLAWAALEAGRRLKVPVVGFYHSDLPRMVSVRAGKWARQWLNSYTANLYRRFDRVFAASQVMADKLLALGVEQVHVQPLGVDPTEFSPDHNDPALRRKLGLRDGTRLLVFGGRGAPEKNLGVLLEAMTLLGDGYHLHLVGSHMPAHLPRNVSKTEGFVEKPQLARWLASSDALVHAGDRETFGLIILEAMASGIPVVGVRAGAVAELVVPGTGLLAEPRSPGDMADAVRALFADNWREMGERARRRAEECFAWDRVLPRLADHYLELCGKTAADREAEVG